MDKCPYCNKPNVFYRKDKKDLFCGWCKRFFVFETDKPKLIGQRIKRLGKWVDILE